MPSNYETTHVCNKKITNLATRASKQEESVGEKALKQTGKCRCCWLDLGASGRTNGAKIMFPNDALSDCSLINQV
jgi:hypothetical protein